MSKLVIFKGKVPTPYMRFFDRNSFDAWLMLQNDAIEIEVSGVNPYTTLYYIDVNLEDNPKYKSINWQSEIGYIKVVPDLESQTFFAFVDRVERNELDENSIRIYYKVDWWDTLLMQGDEPFIVGDVVRAHVNDIVNGKITLDNTNLDCEVTPDVNDYVIEKYIYPFTSGVISSSGLAELAGFYHIILTQGAFENFNLPLNRSIFRYIPEDLPTSTTSQFVEIVLPINNQGQIYPYTIGGVFYDNPDLVSIIDLKTDNVVGVYMSTRYEDGIDITDNELNVSFNSDSFSGIKPPETLGLGTALKLPCRIKSYSAVVDSNVNLQHVITSYKYNNFLPLVDKESYNEYLQSGVVKYNTHIYKPLILTYGNETLNIEYTFAPTRIWLEISAYASSNSFAVWFNNSKAGEEAQLSVLPLNIISPSPVADKYFDRLISEQNATKADITTKSKAIEGVIKSFALLLVHPAAVAASAVSTVFDFVNNAATASYEVAKDELVQRGILQTGSVSSSLQSSTYAFNFPNFVYVGLNSDSIRENLAFYGYNTHLQPHEILKNHKRKYFNFIKTSSCNIINIKNTTNVTYRNYSAEVRNDIESMLNGGVWLFSFVSKEELFNLEVPNYPLSAGYEE